jgi:hypothetical protein
MKNNDIEELYFLYLNCSKIYLNPFKKLLEKWYELKGEKEVVSAFNSLEKEKQDLLKEIESYKVDFQNTLEAPDKTTLDKEKVLSEEFTKRLEKIHSEGIKYISNWNNLIDQKITPLILKLKQEYLEQKESYKTDICIFLEDLESFFKGGDIEQEARYFVNNKITDKYIFTVVDPAKKDKEYYTKKGQGHLYQEALEGLLKVYNLSFDMILWSDLLLEELILDRKLSNDKPSDFNAYISSIVDRYIESKEKEMIEAYNVLNGLPEKKQSLIGKIFK